ncbi:SSK2 [Candida pseudojiufengensis]|uniref:SSK2 n=1 Tax=Candida pseudojiufengensis TaxID=497109 RepID=UPI0022242B62|nr:SSK2 [Candida pseudojiufengensis]KAI5959412.1 SSK2 [Candida pseudojiufengensis]
MSDNNKLEDSIPTEGVVQLTAEHLQQQLQNQQQSQSKSSSISYSQPSTAGSSRHGSNSSATTTSSIKRKSSQASTTSQSSSASARQPSLLRAQSTNNALPSNSQSHVKRTLSNGNNNGNSKPPSNPSKLSYHINQTPNNPAQKSRPSISRSASGSILRTRSRSLTSTLQYNQQQLQHHLNSQYAAQEKSYLRKLKNQLVDDYYTKGITGADDEDVKNFEDEDDDEEDYDMVYNDGDNANLLAAIDDDKYQIDYSMALSLMKNANVNLKKIANVTTDDSDDPAVIERLDWQSLLTTVLTGDVVRSEKTKIINNHNPDNPLESYLHTAFKEDIWFGIRAKIFNRTEDDQRKIVAYRRTLVEQLIEDILQFEVSYDDTVGNPIHDQVESILNRYDEACNLWRNLEDMRIDKPACRSEEFQNRIDALTAWLTITDAINRETQSLRLWIGNDELDITKSPVELPINSSSTSNSKIVKKIFDEDNKSLAERLMKEKDVHTIFRKRIFKPISPWMIKSKETHIRLGHMFEIMKLPDYLHDLIQICIIPMKLIKEIIIVRLGYAMKLQNPTLMMIDQMLDDFQSYITIALEVKSGIQEYKQPDPENKWLLNDLFDTEINDFDSVVLRCIRYFLALFNKKLLDSSRSQTNFRTFKEPEELEEAWSFLQSLGNYIDGGCAVVAEEIAMLTSRLNLRLLAYFNHSIKFPHTDIPQDLIRWYSTTLDNFGQIRRKLARFTGDISRSFTNSLVFEVPSQQHHNNTKQLLDVLRTTNHFLVYTNTVETQGTYFFASPELMGNEQEILKIINGSYVALDPKTKKKNFSELLKLLEVSSDLLVTEEEEEDPLQHAYVAALCPMKPIVWEGVVVNVNIDSVPITDLKNGQLLVISKVQYFDLHLIRDKFLDIVGDVIMSGGAKPIEQRCSLAVVHQELTKTNKAFFRMSLSVLESVKIALDNFKKLKAGGDYQAVINNYFVFARDYGKNAARNLDASRKSAVIMKLIQLAIDWVSFICDDCVPTDRKTFRWCVLALEFAMDMTRGFNVLLLNDEQFSKLKTKVARCMSLLISHFDIMGARSSEAEKNKLLKWSSQRQNIANSQNDEYSYQIYHDELMQQIAEIEDYRKELSNEYQSIGKVIDNSDTEYQFVTLLASSFSSVSIRWQKGRYIGGGTFGQVFCAVNLDTGGIMAVKEIRFHDSQSVKSIVPQIKEEMTVLEMLNHPNVVQYFGVEVHRDKVYIFMEFCEGGSLSGLLTHGRIEDEMVVQVYTLQMLEGLAYLHQSGVVHRDIKPENILLDHNGVIKFVDFGAAKVIANSGRTRVATKSMRPESGNQENLNSMTGTPMYMSPEVITGASTDRSGVVDIWSLGCCVLEMATGRRPWANLDNEWAIMYHIAAGHKPQLPSPEQLSEDGRRFVSRCLEHDPTKRPSAVELLNDPWMISIRQVAFSGGSDLSTPSSENGSLV